MTRNRTGIDLLSIVGNEFMLLLLLVLAMGLAVAKYMTVARDRMRRVEGKLRRRSVRRVGA